MYQDQYASFFKGNDFTWTFSNFLIIQVTVTPFALGFLFGPKALLGFLPGAIVSGVQMAISASNTGGAWDNAKKYIEAGMMIAEGKTVVKGS